MIGRVHIFRFFKLTIFYTILVYGCAKKAAIFTRDIALGEKIAREDLQAGTCVVNGLVKSDPRLPFGGIKESGYGRELGMYGIHEFVNVKTVWVG